MAVGGDLALPEVEGDRPLTLRLTNAYVERLLRVAEHDPVVAAAFNDVADLLAPPQSIMRPRVLWRVLRGPQQRPPARRRGSVRRLAPAVGDRRRDERSGDEASIERGYERRRDDGQGPERRTAKLGRLRLVAQSGSRVRAEPGAANR